MSLAMRADKTDCQYVDAPLTTKRPVIEKNRGIRNCPSFFTKKSLTTSCTSQAAAAVAFDETTIKKIIMPYLYL